ncbi:hypothetical protein D3C87_1539020 [compost metagenome]
MDERLAHIVAAIVRGRLARMAGAVVAGRDVGIAASEHERIEPGDDIGGMGGGLVGGHDQRDGAGMALDRFEIAVLDGLGRLALDGAATGDDPDHRPVPGRLRGSLTHCFRSRFPFAAGSC